MQQRSLLLFFFSRSANNKYAGLPWSTLFRSVLFFFILVIQYITLLVPCCCAYWGCLHPNNPPPGGWGDISSYAGYRDGGQILSWYGSYLQGTNCQQTWHREDDAEGIGYCETFVFTFKRALSNFVLFCCDFFFYYFNASRRINVEKNGAYHVVHSSLALFVFRPFQCWCLHLGRQALFWLQRHLCVLTLLNQPIVLCCIYTGGLALILTKWDQVEPI